MNGAAAKKRGDKLEEHLLRPGGLRGKALKGTLR